MIVGQCPSTINKCNNSVLAADVVLLLQDIGIMLVVFSVQVCDLLTIFYTVHLSHYSQHPTSLSVSLPFHQSTVSILHLCQCLHLFIPLLSASHISVSVPACSGVPLLSAPHISVSVSACPSLSLVYKCKVKEFFLKDRKEFL